MSENKPMISSEAVGTVAMVGVIMAFLALVGVYHTYNLTVETAISSGQTDATIGVAQARSIEELRSRIEKLEAGMTAMAPAAGAQATMAAPAATAKGK
jgi:hypothetical protein